MEATLIPFRSKVLGFGAVAPVLASATAAGLVPPLRSGLVPRAGIVWAGTVLAFLGGVRRGLSFRTPGGPGERQMLGIARSFGLAAAALLSARPRLSCLLLAAGFTDVAVNDPVMAEHDEAPAFFAELRPPQMALAVAGLLALAAVLRSDAAGGRAPGRVRLGGSFGLARGWAAVAAGRARVCGTGWSGQARP